MGTEPMVTRPVVAVVLAGGLSRRMGAANKLLLPVAGQPMVRHAVLMALQSTCQRVVVVLGHEAGRVRQALLDLPVTYVVNPAFSEGLGASVRAGALAVDPGEAVVFCLADMPGLDAAVVDHLIRAYRANPGFMGFQASVDSQRGNPVLWSPGSVAPLQALSGDQGARPLLRRYPARILPVEVGCKEVTVDVDTPQDYWHVYNRRSFFPPTELSRPL